MKRFILDVAVELLWALAIVLLVTLIVRADDDKPTSASASSMTVTNPTATSASTATAPTSQSVTENFPHQAPAVFVPPADSTSSCRNAISLGGSFLTGGAGAGFSRNDSECEKRAAAEAFSKIGDQEDAFLLLCRLKVAKFLHNCKDSHIPEGVERRR